MRKRWNRISENEWEIQEGIWRLYVQRRFRTNESEFLKMLTSGWAIWKGKELISTNNKDAAYVSSAKRACEKAFAKGL